MKVNFAHICDHALVAEGKLSVIGIFEGIQGESFPLTHPLAFLAFEIGIAAAEMGKPVSVEIKIRDADGQDLAHIQVTLKTTGSAPPGTNPTFRHFIAIRNMKFEKPGQYEFAFFLNDRYEHSLRLNVSQLPSSKKQD